MEIEMALVKTKKGKKVLLFLLLAFVLILRNYNGINETPNTWLAYLSSAAFSSTSREAIWCVNSLSLTVSCLSISVISSLC